MKTKTTLILLILLNLISLNVFAQNFDYIGLNGHSDAVTSVAFSPDGKMLASAGGEDDNTIRLWNAKTGATLKVLRYETSRGWRYNILSVAFSPDGSILASGHGLASSGIRLWNVRTGEILKTLTGHGDDVHSVAFSPDGKTLASGSSDNTIRLWNVDTGETLKTLTGHVSGYRDGIVYSVAFSPDGQTLASASQDKTVRLWDVQTGVNLKTLTGHGSVPRSVAFSPDGQTLASGSYRGMLLWDVETGETSKILTFNADYGNVNSVAFSPDGKTIASGSSDGYNDGGIRLWDVQTGEILKLMKHGGYVNSVVFSPDGQTLASGSSNSWIGLWDVNTGENRRYLGGHRGAIYDVWFSADGQTVTSRGADNALRVWNTTTGGYSNTLMFLNDSYDVAFHPDGQILASGGADHVIRLRDIETGETLHTLSGHGGDIYNVAFHPDGTQLASASEDETVRLWDVNTGAHLNTLIGHKGWVGEVRYSPDGTILASSGADGTIRLWDANTSDKLMDPLTGHTGAIRIIAFSPDGKMIASGSDDDTIRLWDVQTGKTIKVLRRHSSRNYNDAVYSVSFSPDGNTLASGAEDATIRLWDVNTGGHLKTLTGHYDAVYSVAFSPDGKMLASGGGDRTLRLWNLPPTRVTITPNPVVPPGIGEQFTLNIGITAGSNIFGYELSLGFDPKVVRFVESANGNFLQGAHLVQPVVSNNSVKLAGTALTALGNGNGTLITATFEVVAVTESTINLFGLHLIDSAEQRSHSFEDSAFIVPSLTPSSAVVSLTPASVESPAIGERLTFDLEIAGGENLAKQFFSVDYDRSALKWISFQAADTSNLDPMNVVKLGTITFEVLQVKNSTVRPSNYYVASNGLRFLPTFVGANVIVPIPGDVNKDGVVNILDLVVVASNFGQTVADGANPAADLNEDGVINIIDLVKVAGSFDGEAAAPLALSQNLKGTLTRAEVQEWLTQAQQANLTDAISLRDIHFLEQLLAALTPRETALFPNYPNPFNPETWIPYQLSKPAAVRISIYAADGTLVRTLDLGHQPMGMYKNRNRAAHWDGRNTLGESVASGIYFYELTAGDFSATRRMLILK